MVTLKTARSEHEAQAMGALVGQTVKAVEIDSDGTALIEFDNGLMVAVECDAEGNGPGALHLYDLASVGAGACLGVVGGR